MMNTKMNETKRRKSFRKLVIGDDMWQYKVGRGDIIIYSPDNKQHAVRLNVFLGLDWNTIERLHWKMCGDHAANVRPGAIRTWIEENLT
jgi:hypothetical protein